MKIYVGNLSYQTDEETLRKTFSQYGDVETVNVIIDRETGRSKGFGFVEMPNDDQAKAAIDSLNGTELEGRTIKVSESRPKEQRPGGGRGMRGPRRY